MNVERAGDEEINPGRVALEAQTVSYHSEITCVDAMPARRECSGSACFSL